MAIVWKVVGRGINQLLQIHLGGNVGGNLLGRAWYKKGEGDALKVYYRSHRNSWFITDVKTNFTGKIEGSYREPRSLPALWHLVFPVEFKCVFRAFLTREAVKSCFPVARFRLHFPSIPLFPWALLVWLLTISVRSIPLKGLSLPFHPPFIPHVFYVFPNAFLGASLCTLGQRSCCTLRSRLSC